MTEILRHYSHAPVDRILFADQDDTPTMKPLGLWLSVDGNGDGWREWCEGEDFHTGWTHVYDAVIDPGANILRITTAQALRDFHEVYHGGDQPIFDGYIRWRDLAEKFDGVLISPYQYECRFTPDMFWYYGWDCASACIWAPDMVSLQLCKAGRV